MVSPSTDPWLIIHSNNCRTTTNWSAAAGSLVSREMHPAHPILQACVHTSTRVPYPVRSIGGAHVTPPAPSSASPTLPSPCPYCANCRSATIMLRPPPAPFSERTGPNLLRPSARAVIALASRAATWRQPSPSCALLRIEPRQLSIDLPDARLTVGFENRRDADDQPRRRRKENQQGEPCNSRLRGEQHDKNQGEQ